MPALLRLLIVEDSVDDALLAVRELKRAGYEVIFERVETASEMLAALEQNTWDLVIADYSLPKFSGIGALELLKSTGLDIPFVIISGSIGEDVAVDVMKSGAHDYIMKGNVKRLVPSIERELRDAEVRRKQRQAEEALRDSEARKAAIFDSSLDSIISIDHAGRIIEFNPQAERTFGYRRDDVIGQPMAELIIPPSLRSRHRVALARYLATGTGSVIGRRVELTGMRSDGSEFSVELSLTSISTKTQPMFTAYLRDLTEQKKQEEAAQRSRELEEQNLRIQEANRLKSEFLANMSHELRTPLNAIVGFSELMHDGKVGPVSAEHKEYLGDILSSSHHLLQLINDLLDNAKIEAGRMAVLATTFPVTDLIVEITHNLAPIMSVKKLKLIREIPEDLPPITTDRRKLLQILLNLASNAVKFTERGEIGLRCRATGGALQLAVSDTGIGIKASDLDLLFRPFSQIDSGLQKRQEGTGLGLHLSQNLARLLGGAIAVESEYGKGSTFTLTVPLQDRSRYGL
jgi:protein-histidine pros-kinase